MKWRVEFRPEVEQDVAEAAAWYEARQPGWGQNLWKKSSESGMLSRRIR